MTTPVLERPEPTYNMDNHTHIPQQRSSDDDGTYIGDDLSHHHSNSSHAQPDIRPATRPRSGTHLTVETQYDYPSSRRMQSPSQSREKASRLDDDLALLQIERDIDDMEALNRGTSQTRSMTKVRSRRDEPVDEFDAATNPLHEQAARYRPPENPNTSVSKFFKKIHSKSWLVRYFTYITPLVLIILIPILIGALVFPDSVDVGGVKLSWFGIWLMIVWLTLWAGRVSLVQTPQCDLSDM
jgi:hypothetical protein